MYSAKDILLQILTETSERGFVPGKTQLVKLLYLAEIDHFRSQRERLTELRWLFHHYGPYAIELEMILASPEFEKTEIKTQADKDFIRFRVAENMGAYLRKIEPKVTLLIKRLVGQWKDKPLEELLDYVYFETEPMQAVKKRGDVLDFTTIMPESAIERVIPLKASREAEKKVARLRERIRPFLGSMGGTQSVEAKESDDYAAAMKAWAEEEGAGLTIPPEIIVYLTKPSADSANKGN